LASETGYFNFSIDRENYVEETTKVFAHDWNKNAWKVLNVFAHDWNKDAWKVLNTHLMSLGEPEKRWLRKLAEGII